MKYTKDQLIGITLIAIGLVIAVCLLMIKDDESNPDVAVSVTGHLSEFPELDHSAGRYQHSSISFKLEELPEIKFYSSDYVYEAFVSNKIKASLYPDVEVKLIVLKKEYNKLTNNKQGTTFIDYFYPGKTLRIYGIATGVNSYIDYDGIDKEINRKASGNDLVWVMSFAFLLIGLIKVFHKVY